VKETEEMTVEQLQQLITKKKTEALHKKIQQFRRGSEAICREVFYRHEWVAY
jgi:hypothetical protein